jgi:osmotically inducible protein OsmC
MLIRSAHARWTGDVLRGQGHLSTQTGTLHDTPYSFKTRFEGQGAGTNPEELLAAAHAGCFTMATAALLGRQGHTPTRLATEARVTLVQDGGGFTITRVDLALQAEVPGLDEAGFRAIAEDAKRNCPLSKVLRCEITLEVTFRAG